MKNNSKRQKELETGDRERSERKVTRGKKRQRKDDSNHGNLTRDDRDNKRRIYCQQERVNALHR